MTQQTPNHNANGRDDQPDTELQSRPASIDLSKAQRFKIGLWGTSQSGKTTYLARVHQAFMNYGSSHDWTISQDDAANEFVLRANEALENKTFPEKTAYMRPYHYYIERTTDADGESDKRTIDLYFNDVPGELFEAYYSPEQRQDIIAITQQATEDVESNSTPQAAFDELRDSDGYIIFIDPAWQGEERGRRSYHLFLQQFLMDLREWRDPQLPPPRIALMMTKADGSKHIWQRRKVQQDRCFRAVHDPEDERGSSPEERNLLDRLDRGQGLQDSVRNRPSEHIQGLAYCRIYCPIFEQLGKEFMWDTLPGLLKPLAELGHVRCFVVSAIGRPSDERSNVGDNNIWKRRLTEPMQHLDPHQQPLQPRDLLTPPATDSGDDPLKQLIAQFDRPLEEKADETFYPTSINSRELLRPEGLLDPLIWSIFGN
jgi:hypothetical protein